jgi:hypothetical protein
MTSEATKLQEYARKLLVQKMGDISEDHWAASWLIDMEYSLWGIMQGDRTPDFGMGAITDQEKRELSELCGDAGGWFYFDEKTMKTFVPLFKWLEMYAAWRAKKPC